MTPKSKFTLPWSRLLTISTFLLPFALYAFTAYPTVATEDSGELIAAAHHLGIAHPPGYPLYALLGKLFIILNPFGPIAWKVNIMSAFFGAATITTLFLILKKITQSKGISVAFALLLAGSPIFWSQAIRAEVYTLNTFCFSLILYLTILWSGTNEIKKSSKLLLLISFFFGLSLGNHHSLILAAPALALFIFLKDRTLWKNIPLLFKMAGLFITGMAIYLYLPIRSLANPAIDWGNPETWENFWKVFFRESYGGSFSSFKVSHQVHEFFPDSWSKSIYTVLEKNLFNVFPSFKQSGKYFIEDLFNQFHIFFPFIFGGIYLLCKKSTRKKHPYSLFIVFLLFLFSAYLLKIIGGSYHVFNRLQNAPFYLPAFILSAIIVGFTINWIISQKTFKPFAKALVTLTVLLAATNIPLNFTTYNQRDNFIAYDIYRNVLHQLPQNSVFYMPRRDNSIFPLFYLQKVENFRNDVTIYATNDHIYPQWESFFEARKKHPQQRIFTYIPVTHDPLFHYKHWPLFSEYFNKNEPLPSRTLTTKETIRGIDHSNLYYHDRDIAGSYYVVKGINETQEQPREKFFVKALEIAPQSDEVYYFMGNHYTFLKDNYKATKVFEAAYKLNPKPLYKEYIQLLRFGNTSL